MSELAVTLLRLSYLVLLWVFVLGALAVLRQDIFGTRLNRRPQRDRRAAAAATARKAAAAPPSAPPRPAPQPAAPVRTGTRHTPTRLVVSAGPLAGASLPLGPGPILVGRAPGCTLVLDDDYSSGRHARFFPQDGQWWLEDLGSTNGTFVRDERISTPVVVPAGTPVRIGQTVIELQR
ncbi:FHA domain-containing protein FhaB/FipA [Georgenia faecalis]|uniref:FHA domain-containing protein n=1 Tax=Georgenia faecalis TaxID=2483799 RepID=A0ABV9D7U4_9MICO|nr:FHA domain-containing protein [Georgenia faecalis]